MNKSQLVKALQSTTWRPRAGFFGKDDRSPCALMQIINLNTRPIGDSLFNIFQKKTGIFIPRDEFCKEIMSLYDNCKSANDWEEVKLQLANKYIAEVIHLELETI